MTLKRVIFVAVVLLAGVRAQAQSLPDTAQLSRLAEAKTICASEDSSISFNRKDKPSDAEMIRHSRNMLHAQVIAMKPYRHVTCDQAELVVRTDIDLMFEHVNLRVVESETGQIVWYETRSLMDEQSDLIALARHFRNAVTGAKFQAENARKKSEEATTQDAQTLARAQFEELSQAGGIPKWAGSVCFLEQFKNGNGSLVDADEKARSGEYSAVFIFIREDASRTKLQWFNDGVPTPIKFFKNLSTADTRSVSKTEPDASYSQHPRTGTFEIMWKSGRFEEHDHMWVEGKYQDVLNIGHCEGVNDELAGAAQ